MTIEKPIGPRRSTTESSATTAVSRESVIDPALTSIPGGAAASAGDLIADSERDDEPTDTAEVPTSVAGINDTGVDPVGVPIPDEVSIGFDESDSTDVAAGLGAEMESLLPSAFTRHADRLDALKDEADVGADETDRFGSIDRSAIANHTGVEYQDTVYEGGSTQRHHYSDGKDVGTQTWNDDGSYWERWDFSDDVWELDENDRVTERSYNKTDDVHVDVEDDGTVKRIFPGGTDEVHTIKPNGDLEIDDGEGNRIVVHPGGSQTEYRGDGRIIHTPAPQEGTGGGEGEGESSTQQNEKTDEQKRQEEEAKRQEEEAKRQAEEDAKKEEEKKQQEEEAEEEQSSDGGGGAGEGEDEGSEEESASRPEGEFDPAAEELLAAGRAFGFHPGAAGRHGATGSGDVDPADPSFDGGAPVVGEIVDLKQRLLVDPPDPDVVGGTGRGTIPDSIDPDGGVIDPSDDSVGGPGGMGAEDDPFGGMQPALEPDASDPVGDDPVFEAIDPSVSAFDDLDLEPTRADSIMDFDGHDL